MAETSPVRGPTLAEKREQTIQLLIDSFASDSLSVEDFEDRLDRAHRAPDLGSLESLVRDLPAVVEPKAPDSAPRPQVPARAAEIPGRPAQPLPADIRERQFMVAIMGGHQRSGPWTPARKSIVLAMMGGSELDFREARLGPGVTEIEIYVAMGGVEIIVPPWVTVDSGGFALMGGFGHGPGRTEATPPDAPVLRITGVAIMGGVDITTRLPGESARDAKRRLRMERKLLKGRRRELP